MLHVICTRLRPGHLSVRVGDSSRRCEEIVKKISNSAFECDYYYYITLISPSILCFSHHSYQSVNPLLFTSFLSVRQSSAFHITLISPSILCFSHHSYQSVNPLLFTSLLSVRQSSAFHITLISPSILCFSNCFYQSDLWLSVSPLLLLIVHQSS